ncbi:MAG: hypothetical protein ACE5KZ_10420 [Candidatus Scalinduaceae bacterium]
MGRWSYSDRITVEECKSINTFWLNQHNFFNGGIQIGSVIWSRGGEKRGSIGLQVSTIKGDEHVRFQYTQTDRFSGQKTELDYKVRLVFTPCNYGGHRWWFLCPLVVNGRMCNRRVGVLYLGGDYFGCRHCYDLTYECQKESGKFDSFFKSMGLDPKEARRALKGSY